MHNAKILLLIVILIVSISLVGCKENKPNNEENQNSGDVTETIIDTYNNGSDFVKYDGKTYFREYRNQNIEAESTSTEYAFNKEDKSKKYINVISPNGEIKNAFTDSGYGEIYVLDNKFFATSYNDAIYVCNLDGSNYLELCKGNYEWADEINHKMYYKNYNNNSLYAYDSQTARIRKITEEDFKIICIENEKIYCLNVLEEGKLTISVYDINKNDKTDICTIDTENSQYTSENISVAKAYLKDSKLVFIVEYSYEETAITSSLYVADLTNDKCELIEEGIESEMLLEENEVYYQSYNFITLERTLKVLDLDTLKVQRSNSNFRVENNLIVNLDNKFSYLKDNAEVEVLTAEEIDAFKQKYDPEGIVTIRDIQKVDDVVFYLVEVSKQNGEVYERVASEMYMYNSKGRNVLLYLYKATDEPDVSGDTMESGDKSGDYEEPLAENEMYINIDLSNKGLRDTFTVRVEEEGGIIKGKLIVYEGTHKREDGIIKIKARKEIGAMLSVYIDDKLDSQMLIEE